MRFPPVFLILALICIAAQAQEGGEAPAAAEAIPTAAPPADTPKAAPATDVKPNAPAETGGDYEIDYEEEDEGGEAADEGEAEPAEPAAKPVKRAKPTPKKAPVAARSAPANDRSAPTSQGTRSKNRFAPLLKSEAKSIYKKNGKSLDVDTD